MAGQDLQRREMLRIMATAAAASKFQGFAKWAFICSHDSSAVERIRPESYQPLFFSPSEYAVVARLTEIIYKEIDNPALKFYAKSPACPHPNDPEHKHLPRPKW